MFKDTSTNLKVEVVVIRKLKVETQLVHTTKFIRTQKYYKINTLKFFLNKSVIKNVIYLF